MGEISYNAELPELTEFFQLEPSLRQFEGDFRRR